MNINDINNMIREIKEDMPLGTREVTFKKIDYRIDRETQEITGAFIHTEEWSPLFIPVFEDLNKNFNLDYLLSQLDCKTYNPEEINKEAGTVIKVTKYIRTVKLKEPYTDEQDNLIEYANYTNVSFNPKFRDTIRIV